jgi:hypothetical protein
LQSTPPQRQIPVESTHVPPWQSALPSHLQNPFEQANPVGQARPQAPQLSGSVSITTQNGGMPAAPPGWFADSQQTRPCSHVPQLQLPVGSGSGPSVPPATPQTSPGAQLVPLHEQTPDA